MNSTSTLERSRTAVVLTSKRGARRVRRSRRLLFTVMALLVTAGLLAALVGAALVWTQWQWFDDMGQPNVFWVGIWSAAVVWALFTLAGFAIVQPAARAAWRTFSPRVLAPRTTVAFCLLFVAWMAVGMSRQWMVFRLAADRSSVGVTDPQFGHDAGFYIFTLPALQLLASWLLNVITLSIVVAATILLLSGRVESADRQPLSRPRVRRLLFIQAGLLMVVCAANFALATWRLNYTMNNTSFAGASYSDVHAQIPANIALLVGCLILAVLLWWSARSGAGLRALIIGVVVFTLAFWVVGKSWPAVVQRLVVAPNEATVQAPYIQRNITMTRDAFDLAGVKGQQYPGSPSLSGSAATAAQKQLAEVPIWTPASVSQAFNQLQTIRPYYALSPAQYDRYAYEGRKHLVLISGREINPTGLPANAQTWVNQHLVYTHGFGVAMSSASRTTGEGFPEFIVGNVPAQVNAPGGPPGLQIQQPRIYFGPGTNGWIAVNTAIDEFDYPSGERNVTCRCAGPEGIRLGNLANRIAWSVRLASPSLLISDYVHDDSRIIATRNVSQIAQRLAPWLAYGTPYPAIIDGHVQWIIDGYTSSNQYPYSQPQTGGVNYLRNSVKVVVDAYTGHADFYANGDDAIRDAWARIYPGLITPQDQVPPAVAAHFRPPMRLFATQAAVYQTYHMTDPTVFYNQEDLWRTPVDASGNPVQPQYVMWDPPGPAPTGMYLLQPYSLPSRDNLVGWMAMATEPHNPDERTVYLLPKDRVTLGAAAVTARINQDPTVSQQLTLWNQPGSSTVFGNMLVLPIEGSVAYVQPIFLQAQNSSITELAGVIVVNGDRVALGRSVQEALAKAYG